MRTALHWLVVSLSLSAASSELAHGFGSKRPARPAREVCVLGESGCLCFDARLDEDKRSYIRPYTKKFTDGGCLDFIATNPVDYDAGEEWIARNCFGPPRK